MPETVDHELVAAALEIMVVAYCPYSSFPVGCALRDSDNRVHVGVNVENAAYPVGTCAEAGAIAAMVAAGGRKIVALAVCGRGEHLVTPCGACRQRIRELAAPDVPVLVCGPEGLRRAFTLAQLLPASFGPEHLGQPD